LNLPHNLIFTAYPWSDARTQANAVPRYDRATNAQLTHSSRKRPASDALLLATDVAAGSGAADGKAVPGSAGKPLKRLRSSAR
jgi:hypothetical protein